MSLLDIDRDKFNFRRRFVIIYIANEVLDFSWSLWNTEQKPW